MWGYILGSKNIEILRRVKSEVFEFPGAQIHFCRVKREESTTRMFRNSRIRSSVGVVTV